MKWVAGEFGLFIGLHVGAVYRACMCVLHRDIFEHLRNQSGTRSALQMVIKFLLATDSSSESGLNLLVLKEKSIQTALKILMPLRMHRFRPALSGR